MSATLISAIMCLTHGHPDTDILHRAGFTFAWAIPKNNSINVIDDENHTIELHDSLKFKRLTVNYKQSIQAPATEIYHYDNQNRLIDLSIYRADSARTSWVPTIKYMLEYTQDGHVFTTSQYPFSNYNSEDFRWIYKYDPQLRQTIKTEYGWDPQTQQWRTQGYNAPGKIAFSSYGIRKDIDQYDSLNRLISSTSYLSAWALSDSGANPDSMKYWGQFSKTRIAYYNVIPSFDINCLLSLHGNDNLLQVFGSGNRVDSVINGYYGCEFSVCDTALKMNSIIRLRYDSSMSISEIESAGWDYNGYWNRIPGLTIFLYRDGLIWRSASRFPPTDSLSEFRTYFTTIREQVSDLRKGTIRNSYNSLSLSSPAIFSLNGQRTNALNLPSKMHSQTSSSIYLVPSLPVIKIIK